MGAGMISVDESGGVRRWRDGMKTRPEAMRIGAKAQVILAVREQLWVSDILTSGELRDNRGSVHAR